MRVLTIAKLVLCSLLLVAPLAAAQSAPKSSAAASGPVASVNLNSATREQLEDLPGIGPRTAALILEYRQKSGGFKKIEELMNVRGIGEKSFLKLKPFISVTPKPDKPSGGH